MKPLRRLHRGAVRRSRCLHCEESLVYVREVGWCDPLPGHTYDLCPRERLGNHQVPRERPSRLSRLLQRRTPPSGPGGSEESAPG